MKAHFGLPSVVGDLNEGKPPISVKFEIPYFTTSGIQVVHFRLIQTFSKGCESACIVVFQEAVSLQNVQVRPTGGQIGHKI